MSQLALLDEKVVKTCNIAYILEDCQGVTSLKETSLLYGNNVWMLYYKCINALSYKCNA